MKKIYKTVSNNSKSSAPYKCRNMSQFENSLQKQSTENDPRYSDLNLDDLHTGLGPEDKMKMASKTKNKKSINDIREVFQWRCRKSVFIVCVIISVLLISGITIYLVLLYTGHGNCNFQFF